MNTDLGASLAGIVTVLDHNGGDSADVIALHIVQPPALGRWFNEYEWGDIAAFQSYVGQLVTLWILLDQDRNAEARIIAQVLLSNLPGKGL